jgi:hypothetical protein
MIQPRNKFMDFTLSPRKEKCTNTNNEVYQIVSTPPMEVLCKHSDPCPL